MISEEIYLPQFLYPYPAVNLRWAETPYLENKLESTTPRHLGVETSGEKKSSLEGRTLVIGGRVGYLKSLLSLAGVLFLDGDFAFSKLKPQTMCRKRR